MQFTDCTQSFCKKTRQAPRSSSSSPFPLDHNGAAAKSPNSISLFNPLICSSSNHSTLVHLGSKYTSKALKLIGALTNSVKMLTSHFTKAYPSGNKLQRMMSVIISGPEKPWISVMDALLKNGKAIWHDFTMKMSNL